MPTKKFGEIYSRPDSPHLWIWYYDAAGNRKQESTKTTDKKLAREILQSRVSEFHRLREGLKTKSDMPYKHFSEDFLKHYKARYGFETVKSHTSAVNQFGRFLKLVEISRLSEITPEVIEKYVTFLRSDLKRKANTCNNHLKNIHTQFTYAIKCGLVDKNPAHGCQKIEVNDAAKKGALSRDDYKKLLKTTQKECPFYYPIFYTFIHTGLRFTELINLKWSNIDFKGQVLWIQKPKGKKRPDYVSIHGGVIKVLKALPQKSEYVFINEQGEHFGHRTRKIIRHLQDVLKKAEITSISTLHELRHTYCSYLFTMGLNPREVQRAMRHSDLSITEQYAHIFAPEYNKKIARLERLDR